MYYMTLQINLNLKAITAPTSEFQVLKSEKEQAFYILAKQTEKVVRIYKFDGTVSNYAGSQGLKKYEVTRSWPVSGLVPARSDSQNSISMNSNRSDSPESSGSDRDSPVSIEVDSPKAANPVKTVPKGNSPEIYVAACALISQMGFGAVGSLERTPKK